MRARGTLEGRGVVPNAARLLRRVDGEGRAGATSPRGSPLGRGAGGAEGASVGIVTPSTFERPHMRHITFITEGCARQIGAPFELVSSGFFSMPPGVEDTGSDAVGDADDPEPGVSGAGVGAAAPSSAQRSPAPGAAAAGEGNGTAERKIMVRYVLRRGARGDGAPLDGRAGPSSVPPRQGAEGPGSAPPPLPSVPPRRPPPARPTVPPHPHAAAGGPLVAAPSLLRPQSQNESANPRPAAPHRRSASAAASWTPPPSPTSCGCSRGAAPSGNGSASGGRRPAPLAAAAAAAADRPVQQSRRWSPPSDTHWWLRSCGRGRALKAHAAPC
jgi:hypothetical protein